MEFISSFMDHVRIQRLEDFKTGLFKGLFTSLSKGHNSPATGAPWCHFMTQVKSLSSFHVTVIHHRGLGRFRTSSQVKFNKFNLRLAWHSRLVEWTRVEILGDGL